MSESMSMPDGFIMTDDEKKRTGIEAISPRPSLMDAVCSECGERIRINQSDDPSSALCETCQNL